MYDQLMAHDLTVIKRSQDFSGDLTDGASFSERGFVEYTNEQMVSDDGEEITAKAIVFLKADTNYDEDHADWAIEHGEQRFLVRATERVDDPRTGRTHHYEIGVI